MAEYDVLGYQARDEGSAVAFYDSESCLFLVHASSAASQSQREDLMRTYIAGHKHGRISGQIQMQSEFRKLLNAAPLEPLHLEGPQDMPLDHAQKHLLRLSRQNPAADGWVSVSPVVLPFVKHLPADLIDVEDTKDGWGRAKLTDRGNAVVDYL